MVTNKEQNFISAVVYVHNNEKQIRYFLNNVIAILQESFEKFEIICVNDKSTDNSTDKIKEVAKQSDGTLISILNMSFFQGVELAMNAGVDLAIGDFVYEFDSIDIDYELETILGIYKKSLTGFDIVSAAPYKAKRKFSRIFYSVFNSVSHNQYKLRTESFRILSRRAINRVHSMSKTIPYRKALYANCGLKLASIVYQTVQTNSSQYSKQTNNNRKDMAVDSLILFTNLASKATIIMTVIMMLATIFTAGYTVYIFALQRPVAGWTTTMLFLSAAFFGLFLVLAIIIKYLSLLVDLVFKKQKYTIESIEKL
ncbi:MAG: glycosyl transferase family 2 [Clostridiales bacterium 43-6]|nr:MAG: glycosyl transferase family 2 [Clostridiales bacterium 43-6]